MKRVLSLIVLTLMIVSCEKQKIKLSNAELFAKIDTEIKANAKAYSTLKEASETIGHV